MNKLLIIIGIGAVLAVVGAISHLCCCESGSRLRMADMWLNGFSTLGSFGAVIVALYLDPIRRWLMKPRLHITVSNKSPWCEIENVDADAKKKEEFIDICCKVENVGGSTAKKSRLVCQSILTLGADEKYAPSEDTTFRPQTFLWVDQGERKGEADIAKAFYGLVKIAEIRTVNSELGKDQEGVTSKAGSAHYIVICLPSRVKKNQYIQIADEESVILPIMLFCEGGKLEERDIMITWQGKTIADYHNHPEKLAVTDVTDKMSDLLRKE